MANIPTDKDRIQIRLKTKTIRSLKLLSARASYPTSNLLAAELLEGIIQFVTDKKRAALPEVVTRLKKLDLRATAAPPPEEILPPPLLLTPAIQAAIDDAVERKLTGQFVRPNDGEHRKTHEQRRGTASPNGHRQRKISS